MVKSNQRQLKIHSHQYRSDKQVPHLRLCGVWMEQLGFKIGDRVSITTRNRLLIIEPLQVSEAEQDYKLALAGVKQTLKKLSK